jgi:hypothetical protein
MRALIMELILIPLIKRNVKNTPDGQLPDCEYWANRIAMRWLNQPQQEGE